MSINTQLGIREETVYGTPVLANRFYPITGESLKADKQRLVSQAVTAGKRVQLASLANRGDTSVGGTINMELYSEDMALWFKHALGGTVVTTGAGPYTHVVTPGTLDGKSLTIQKGLEDVSGTVRSFAYAGCKVADWSISASAGSLATASFGVVGQSEVAGGTLATASYSATIQPFSYIDGTTSTIQGVAACVRSFALSGKNSLIDDRRCLGSGQIRKPIEGGLREFSFEAELEFEDLTHYNLFVNDTQSTVSLGFNNGAGETFTIALAAVRWDGETPTHDDFVVQKMMGNVYDSGSASVTITIVNNQSAP